jgi:hypothetical protein
VDRFVRTVGPDDSVKARVLPEGPEQIRAVARFSSTDQGSGDRYEWLVFLILWPRTFLLCSSTSSAGSSLPGDAELMFAAIAPVTEPRRGLFRRTQ